MLDIDESTTRNFRLVGINDTIDWRFSNYKLI